MTWTILLVCLCYVVFVMPVAVDNILGFDEENPRLYLVLFCNYWMQYSVNFVVYALRSEQYRKAYCDYIRDTLSPCCPTFGSLFEVHREAAVTNAYFGSRSSNQQQQMHRFRRLKRRAASERPRAAIVFLKEHRNDDTIVEHIVLGESPAPQRVVEIIRGRRRPKMGRRRRSCYF